MEKTEKVVFEKLLAKWDEIFQRESIFDEIESVEKNFTNTADVYTAPTFKIERKISKNNRVTLFGIIAKIFDEQLSYETGDGKKIIFTFKENPSDYNDDIEDDNDDDDDLLNTPEVNVTFEFYGSNYENDNLTHKERARRSIDGGDLSVNTKENVSTLKEYFSAIGKSEFYSHYKEFINKLESKRVAFEKNQKENEEQKELEDLKGTFDMLNNL